MFNKLDIRQMRTFLLLMQEGSLTRVADQLDMSQQAVSEQLKRLREAFNDPLFVRAGNRMRPSPKAERLAPILAEMVRELELVAQPERLTPDSVSGVFTISSSDLTSSVVIRPVFQMIRRSFPKLKLIVKDLERETLEQSLISGAVDLALSFPEFVPDTLERKLLYRESYGCVASADHWSGPDRLTTDQLLAHEHLVVSPSRPGLQGSSDEWFAAKGLKRNVVASVPTFAAAADYIAGGGVLAFLPRRLLPDPRLVEIELDETPPGFDVIVVWHRRTNAHPLHLWMREALFAQCINRKR